MAKVADHAYQAILELIQSGRYAPGERIRQDELVEACGVSRTPVRDALRRLNRDGFIELRSNNGAYVNAWTEDELSVIFELRATLESIAAKRAADRISAVQLEKLESIASEMEQLSRAGHVKNEKKITQLNREFHRTILKASGSGRLEQMALQVLGAPHYLRQLRTHSIEAINRSMEDHRNLIESLRSGSGKVAEALMRAHVYSAYQRMLRNSD